MATVKSLGHYVSRVLTKQTIAPRFRSRVATAVRNDKDFRASVNAMIEAYNTARDKEVAVIAEEQDATTNNQKAKPEAEATEEEKKNG